jgi:hypothetical protein
MKSGSLTLVAVGQFKTKTDITGHDDVTPWKEGFLYKTAI